MEINLVELDLASIKELHGGQVFSQVQKLIKAAVADCESRVSEKRPRKVLLTLEITPRTRVEEIDDTHHEIVLDGVGLSLNMDIKCPTRKTIEFDCGVGENHSLLFNPENPHNHRQAGLPLTFEHGETVPMTAAAS